MRFLKTMLFVFLLTLVCGSAFAGLEKGIEHLSPQVQMRQYHQMLSSVSITSDYTSNIIRTDNVTAIQLSIVADSSAGTPDYTLAIQSCNDSDFNDCGFKTITDVVSYPAFANHQDEVSHDYLINTANLGKYIRFLIDLGAADGGDDVFDMELNLQYGSMTGVTSITSTELATLDNIVVTHDSTVGTQGAQIMGSARTSQATAVDNGDSVLITTNQYGELVVAGYDWSGDYTQISEVDPVSSHHVEATLADVTNGTDGTYYYYVDMDGYRYLSYQIELDGGSGTVTATVEMTNQDDGTAQASCTYQDVTQGLYGSASFTASNYLFNDTVILAKYARIKIVASTGGANDADWTIYSKKAY